MVSTGQVFLLHLCMVVALAACAGGSSAVPAMPAPAPSASVADASATSCRATRHDVDLSTWREVVAEGFSFCLPPGWKGGARSWRMGSATLAWGRGARPPREVAVVTRRVEVSKGGAPMSIPPAPDSDVQRFSESIGGRPAQLWRNRFGAKYYTGAEWSSASTWLTGTAQDAADAALQIAIYRTVRFHSP